MGIAAKPITLVVTVTGPAGAGKTVLAGKIAALLAQECYNYDHLQVDGPLTLNRGGGSGDPDLPRVRIIEGRDVNQALEAADEAHRVA